MIPGLHSRNLKRHARRPRAAVPFRKSKLLLLLLGMCGLGYYGYGLARESLDQAYENRVFEQQISQPAPSNPTANLAEGMLMGRVLIPRLGLSAIVRQGVEPATLSVAVGHVPSTSLPGQTGNFALAAHRDTLFRKLKDIRTDDAIVFQSSAGIFTYKVRATKIVRPSDVAVLRPDGGGLIPAADFRGKSSDRPRLLTMITCYPFYYVGSAPKRFIVEGELVPAPVILPGETIGRSSNGRTADSGSAYRGSSPCLPATPCLSTGT